MEKNALLAILLTGTIWLGWYMLFPPEQNKPNQAVQTQNQTPQNNTKAENNQIKAVEINAAEPAAKANAVKEEDIEIKTSKFNLILTNRGAAVKSAVYTHKNDIANQKNIELVIDKNKIGTKGSLDFAVHFDENEFLNGGPLDSILWTHIRTDEGVKFSAVINYSGNPLVIEKNYTFPKNGNEIKISYRFKNTGKNTLQFRDSTLIFSPGDSVGPSLDFSNTYNNMSSTYFLNGSFKTDVKGGGFFSKPSDLKKESGQAGWAGIMGRYFLMLMIPEGFSGSAIISNNKQDKPGNRTGLAVKMDSIEAGKDITKQFKIYLGEKDKDALALVDSSIVEAADISSWIEPIRYAVIWTLMGINKFIGNIGWSLIIFSILTKLIFTPLTLKSTKEMKRMGELTPKLNALKEKYKDNPELLNKKTMDFFKENKYNPMGGCLPMIVQMPFFIALYSALANSLDLWNAPFIFWMKDMSMPDTVATISGFTIQILPLLMVATTFIQQKLTSVDAGGQQQKIMLMVLPVVLLFAFWSMPSGLVLYWALQNVFQILQQVIANHMGKTKTAKAA